MRDRVWQIVLAILLVALGLRVAFVLRVSDRPLYWDEPLYERHAKLYHEAWSELVSHADDAGLAEAFRRSTQKGELYSVAVSVVYSIFGPDPRAVYLFQALLDTGTCLLLFALTRAVAGVRAGLIAAALAALYE